MKLSVSAALLALASLSAAQLQTLSEIPNCAKPCAASLPSQCNLGVSCICSDQAFITGISCCIEKACSAADQQKTLMLAQQLCDTVKVTLPSAASCPASAAATGASTASAGASGAAAAGGSTATSAASDGTAMATSAMSNASGSAMSATRMAGATGSPTSTKPSTSSTSATAASGAAHVLGSNMGAMGAAVAALALL